MKQNCCVLCIIEEANVLLHIFAAIIWKRRGIIPFMGSMFCPHLFNDWCEWRERQSLMSESLIGFECRNNVNIRKNDKPSQKTYVSPAFIIN